MPKHHTNSPPSDLETATLVPIVVGAHPKAELFDRPVAYRLRQTIHDRLVEYSGQDDPALLPFRPLVMSDVWYLNDPALRERPTISIGAPGVNALSAFLASRLPSVFVVDDVMMVQLDLELDDLVACCWGTRPDATQSAADVFRDRYLDEFLRAAIRQAEQPR